MTLIPIKNNEDSPGINFLPFFDNVLIVLEPYRSFIVAQWVKSLPEKIAVNFILTSVKNYFDNFKIESLLDPHRSLIWPKMGQVSI